MFKPMLATDADTKLLRFPLLASPKLDGIRAVVRGGIVYSRSNKPIPNLFVQSLFAKCEHFDGELIVGEPTSKTVYRDTTSHVMSHDKRDFNVKLFAFDHIADVDMPYSARSVLLSTAAKEQKNKRVALLEQKHIKSIDELNVYEASCLELGYEGLILRDPNASYKLGRSTAKEGILLKLKRFLDDEAVVIGFEERMHNANEAKTNELGRTARSSAKAGLVPMGTLGALVVAYKGIEFNIGTGFTDEERAHIWSNRSAFLNQLVKFKYFPVGVKDAPRHPVFLGWRDRKDL